MCDTLGIGEKAVRPPQTRAGYEVFVGWSLKCLCLLNHPVCLKPGKPEPSTHFEMPLLVSLERLYEVEVENKPREELVGNLTSARRITFSAGAFMHRFQLLICVLHTLR